MWNSRHFALSAFLSGGTALLHSLVTTIYVRPVTSPGEESVLMGIGAIERVIETYGFASYALNLLPFFIMACLSCWGAFFVLRLSGGVAGSWLRLVMISTGTAVLFALLYRLLIQVTVLPDGAGEGDRVVRGVEGLVSATHVFGVASVMLQLVGSALLFLLPSLLFLLLVRRASGSEAARE